MRRRGSRYRLATMRIDRAGWPYLAVPLASAAVTTAVGRGTGSRWSRRAAWPLLALGAYMAVFFRDPDRRCDTTTPDPDEVLSPADGVVMVAGEPREGVAPDGDWQQVSVFLSVVDVHVNRAPYRGRVTSTAYRPGSFLAAYRKESAHRNERSELWVADGERTVVFRQIVGVLARRIVTRVRGRRAGHRPAHRPDEVRVADGRLRAPRLHGHGHAGTAGARWRDRHRPLVPAQLRRAGHARETYDHRGVRPGVGAGRTAARAVVAAEPVHPRQHDVRLRRDPRLVPRGVPAGLPPGRPVGGLRHRRRRGGPAGGGSLAVRAAVRLAGRPGVLRAGPVAHRLRAVLRRPGPVGPARLARLLPVGGVRGHPAGTVQHHHRPDGGQAVLHRAAQPGGRRRGAGQRVR